MFINFSIHNNIKIMFNKIFIFYKTSYLIEGQKLALHKIFNI